MVLSPLPEGTVKWLKAACQKCYLSRYSAILASKTGILTCLFYSNTAFACAQRHELCRSRDAWIPELALLSLSLYRSAFPALWLTECAFRGFYKRQVVVFCLPSLPPISARLWCWFLWPHLAQRTKRRCNHGELLADRIVRHFPPVLKKGKTKLVLWIQLRFMSKWGHYEKRDLNTCFSTVHRESWELADDVVCDMLHALFWLTL